ncbi:MAG: crotonase/enoyl-CoA hydratase family protein [Hyphomicrobium sp.]|nr:crotonase/enoyl-CoA hydratase family protein [Hyphomicrobium sp.]
MTAHVDVQTSGAIQIIRLVRPEKKNALTGAMYRVLADALSSGDKNDDIAAQVILGSGGVFSAGNDIADFMQAAQSGAGLGDDVTRFITALATVEKPLLAGVDGRAVGIGTTMLFHCDLVYATPAAQFSTPFLDLGLVPEAGSSLLLPRLIGYQRAFEMLVLGAVFSADRARECGFVNHVVEADALEVRVLEAAARLAAKPPEALSMARRLLKGAPQQLTAQMREEERLFSERVRSREAMEAFGAFLEKRPANFGRASGVREA